MKNIVIIGAGGVGRETSMLIEDINHYKNEWLLLGYVDDNESLQGKFINGYKVIANIDWLNSITEETYAVCTVSDPKLKLSILGRIKNEKIKFANLIHPTAVVSNHVNMGEGIIIQAYCIVTTNVALGNHVQLNPQCGIGHDCSIGDYSSLYWNVNISGNVTIDEGCILGTKSTVLQQKHIGRWSILGAASTVTKDIPPYCTALGTPAKPIKFHEEA